MVMTFIRTNFLHLDIPRVTEKKMKNLAILRIKSLEYFAFIRISRTSLQEMSDSVVGALEVMLKKDIAIEVTRINRG